MSSEQKSDDVPPFLTVVPKHLALEPLTGLANWLSLNSVRIEKAVFSWRHDLGETFITQTGTSLRECELLRNEFVGVLRGVFGQEKQHDVRMDFDQVERTLRIHLATAADLAHYCLLFDGCYRRSEVFLTTFNLIWSFASWVRGRQLLWLASDGNRFIERAASSVHIVVAHGYGDPDSRHHIQQTIEGDSAWATDLAAAVFCKPIALVRAGIKGAAFSSATADDDVAWTKVLSDDLVDIAEYFDRSDVLHTRWLSDWLADRREAMNYALRSSPTALDSRVTSERLVSSVATFATRLATEPTSTFGVERRRDDVYKRWPVRLEMLEGHDGIKAKVVGGEVSLANIQNALGELIMGDFEWLAMQLISAVRWDWLTSLLVCRAVTTIIGLKQFQMRENRLPANLDELELSNVTRRTTTDPFSGLPMRFDEASCSVQSNPGDSEIWSAPFRTAGLDPKPRVWRMSLSDGT